MRVLLLAALLLLPGPARGEESAAFLKVGVGARALGMGGAFTAVADDANALSWNPAGLASVRSKEVAATHADLTTGVRFDSLGVAIPLSRVTLAAGGAYLGQDALEGRDAAGRPAGSFTASDSVVSLGFGSRPFGALRVGAAVKHVRSQIANASAQTAALDLGAQGSFASLGPGRALLGFSALNLGPGLRLGETSSPLPLTLSLGGGYALPQGLLLSVDVRHRPRSAQTTEVSVGTEYSFLSYFALRAGYGSARASSGGRAAGSASLINGLAAGFGLRGRGYTLDYAMTPFGDLGNVQRFSLGARF